MCCSSNCEHRRRGKGWRVCVCTYLSDSGKIIPKLSSPTLLIISPQQLCGSSLDLRENLMSASLWRARCCYGDDANIWLKWWERASRRMVTSGRVSMTGSKQYQYPRANIRHLFSLSLSSISGKPIVEMTSFGLLPPDLPRSIGSRGCFVVLHGTGIVPIVDRNYRQRRSGYF